MNQSSRSPFVEYFALARFLIEFAFVQEDVDVYRSCPPLPGTYHPFFYLFPRAHAPPKPNPEETYSMESYIDSSDIEFGRAEDGEEAGDDEGGERCPSPSKGTREDHPKGTRSVA